MKPLLLLARAFSALFRPSHYPMAAFVALFCFTYMQGVPLGYKLWTLSVTALFTIVLPHLGGRLLCLLPRIGALQPCRRLLPPLFLFACLLCYLWLMLEDHMPRFMVGVVVMSLAIHAVCMVVGLFWKISLHSAGAGGLVGALVACGQVFAFNPVWWLALAVLLCGGVMTCRMILRRASLAQVTAGAAVGIVCGFLALAG